MRKTFLLLPAIALATTFLFLFSATPGFSLPSDLILDTYLHPLDNEPWQQPKDIIGNPDYFDILGHRWADGGSSLEIYLTWNLPTSYLPGSGDLHEGDPLYGKIYGAMLGDVFLYDPKGSNDVFIPVRNHDLSYDGDILSQGYIYDVDGVRLSNYYYPSLPTGHYGDNEIVTGNSSLWDQNLFATVSWHDGTDANFILLSFFERRPEYEIPYLGFAGWDIRFAYTCANDVHAPVPEPGTMLLLGVGLIGLAGLGRKAIIKKKNS